MTNDQLHLWYDREGDFLEIRIGKAVHGIYQPVGNECFERVDKKTGKVVGIAVFNFTKRFPTHSELVLPLMASLTPAHVTVK